MQGFHFLQNTSSNSFLLYAYLDILLDIYITLLVLTLFLCVVLEFEFRAYTLSHSTSPFFVIDFLEIGSWELFAHTGFKLRSS
jgi:hypothetical protein